jgi:hypothetical protein
MIRAILKLLSGRWARFADTRGELLMFDRKIYFDSVRPSLFAGSLSTDQVEGQEAILGEWELQVTEPLMTDIRWLAYMLATTYHETAQTMQPIEEYNKGQGMKYGTKDPETGQTYYGRGYVQLTWRDNYARATGELGLKGASDLEWHAEMALDPQIAADVMFLGMANGWFRSDSQGKQTLERYFNDSKDDSYGAREIINGDKTVVPSWSNGVSIGNLIKGYHQKFLSALAAAIILPEPLPPEPTPEPTVTEVYITAPAGVRFVINGLAVDT